MRIAHVGNPGFLERTTFTDIEIISDRSGRGDESYIYGRRLPDGLEFPMEIYNTNGFQFPSYEVEAAQEWLFGKSTPRYLSILDPDKGNFSYLCYLTNPRIAKLGGKVYGWRFAVRCVLPYASSDIIENTHTLNQDISQITEYNTGTIADTYLYPEMSIRLLGNTRFALIRNADDNDRIMEFHDLRLNEEITIDNKNQIIKAASNDNLLNGRFNMNFFRLAPGVNRLAINGRMILIFRYRLQMAVGGY